MTEIDDETLKKVVQKIIMAAAIITKKTCEESETKVKNQTEFLFHAITNAMGNLFFKSVKDKNDYSAFELCATEMQDGLKEWRDRALENVREELKKEAH